MAAREQTRVVILGGGFAGVYTALGLERRWKRDRRINVTLISRHNFFTMTPLLFEAGSGVLEPRHSVSPIRLMLDTTDFVQGEIMKVDLDAHRVQILLENAQPYHLEYDHLVLALGGVTNLQLIQGSQHALTFKTLGDAIFLRNHTIQRFEHADIEPDSARKRTALRFVIVGAGFVGVELQGELTDFVENVARAYRHVSAKDATFELIEVGPRIAAEFDESMSEYATRILRERGVNVRLNTKVNRIEPGRVYLESGETIDADTIVLTAGVAPSPLLSTLPLTKSRKGAVVVDATMRVPDRPGVWALGDNASIPSPSGKPYPNLAQHALREANVLAENITATIRGTALRPFVYETIGLLAALGRYKGLGRIKGLRLKGFLAWWVWRSYYLWQMPRWSRRLRIMIDWTVALLFKTDVVQLELERGEHAPREVEIPQQKI